MKKQLQGSLIVLIMLLTNFSFAQNKSAGISTKENNSFSSANPAHKNSGTQAIITTTTSTCMSINLPAPATWSLVNYGTGTPFAANGFVNGANSYGDKEKAMYFDVSASANTMITQVYVGFGIAYSATPSKTVAIKIYDGTTGTVGAALGSATISMGTIMTDVNNNQYSLIIFPTPVNLPVSKKFFASVDVSGLQWTAGVKDSLSIVSNTSPQSSPSPAWEKWSSNAWYNMSSASSWSLSISLLIHPFLTQAPIVATMSTSGNTICAGQSVSYNSAGSTAGTYEWDFGAIATPTATGATANATYSAAGTYTTYMIVSDACGSLGLTQTTITVKPTPTVSATPSSTTVCNGQNVTLNGSGASTYAWTGGITDGTPFAPASSANYTVTGTAANGCTNSAVSAVNVNPNPTVTANTSTTTVCSGNNITLSGGGASTYVWTGGVTNGVAFAPTSTNSYTVTGTAANTCTGTAVVSVTVAPSPTVSASASSATVCSGNTVTLNGAGASTYAWSGGVNDAVPFAATSTSNYTVTGTAANGCTGTATVSVNVNASPVVVANTTSSVVCSGSTITLTGSGASTYTWSGGVTDGVAFTPTASAVYTVTGSNANNCTGTATVGITVTTCTGIDKISGEAARLNIYPNPNNGEFNVSLTGLTVIPSIEIYNSIGKLVSKLNVNSEKQAVKTDLAAGLYFVKLIENGKVASIQKVIIK